MEVFIHINIILGLSAHLVKIVHIELSEGQLYLADKGRKVAVLEEDGEDGLG